MFKRIFASALTMLLLVASLGYAANMQVNSSAVPVSGGTISPSGIKFSATPVTYTVTPKAGWALTSVLIDGVAATAPYTVPFDTSKIHTVKANFAQTLYSITATAGANGTAIVTGGGSTNITPGSNRAVVVSPNSGFKIDTLLVDGIAVPAAAGSVSAYTTPITAIAASHTVAATFVANAAAATFVDAGGSKTVGALVNSGVTTFSTTLTGSAVSNVLPIVYQWTLISGPAGSSFGTPTASTTTFSGTALGSYVITMSANGVIIPDGTITITVVNAGVVNAGSTACITCHNGSVQATAYATSVHSLGTNADPTGQASCTNCHSHGNPKQCATCHEVGDVNALAFVNTCLLCHKNNSNLAAGVHAIQPGTAQFGCTPCHGTPGDAAHITTVSAGCIGCHSVPITYSHSGNGSAGVADNNNGVRAITTEFAKWSHHVTGVTLDNAHCTACHLEGKVVNGQVVVDTTKHMADAQTHLRNADTDADMAWDPAAPNHSTMDNFCMSCHDANGATSVGNGAVQSYINANGLAAAGKTASPSNPFGDTISNRYDKMQRPAVVNVDDQFNTGNNSHHAVKGPKYTGRTRAAGSRQITNAAAFAVNSSASLFGSRSTIYDFVEADPSGLPGAPSWSSFNNLYVPLQNAGGEVAPRTGALTLGDDSTLHCGDCHTVGQWKPGTALWFNNDGTVDATKTSPAIGAHGSNNEYMLRNSKGTDARHTQNAFVQSSAGVVTYTNPNGAFLVCYNCHSYGRYGSIFLQTGVLGGHVGEYDAGGRCNGIGNTIPFNGYTTGKATDGTQFVTRFGNSKGTPATTTTGTPTALDWTSPATYAGEQVADFGNVLGIQCANCHNSGNGNAYGGIHGSANNGTLEGFTNDPSVTGGSYIDGTGNTTKIVRFLPGLGNAMHVPGNLGGVTGGTTATFLRYSGNAAKTVYTPLPVRSNLTTTGVAPAKLGSYNFQTGGVTNDTNWEQKHWQQGPATILNPTTGAVVAGSAASSGAGCYTLGEGFAPTSGFPEAQTGKLDPQGNVIARRPAISEELRGPSQGVVGQPNPTLFDNWGGCDDHSAPIGGGNHGFVKKIVRPVTY